MAASNPPGPERFPITADQISGPLGPASVFAPVTVPAPAPTPAPGPGPGPGPGPVVAPREPTSESRKPQKSYYPIKALNNYQDPYITVASPPPSPSTATLLPSPQPDRGHPPAPEPPPRSPTRLNRSLQPGDESGLSSFIKAGNMNQYIQSNGSSQPNPGATYQHIHDMAAKRMSTIDYLRKT